MEKARGNHSIKDPKDIPRKNATMIVGINEELTTDHGSRNPRSGRGGKRASQVIIKRKPSKYILKIGTWNVRTLLKMGKLDEVKNQMRKNEIDILGLCETRWEGNGDFCSDEFRVIYSGGERRGMNGVAVIIRGKWSNNVCNTYHVSDRLMMVKLNSTPVDLIIIQAYFPTSAHNLEEVESMYEDIEELLKLTKEKDNVAIMGDFNAVVGSHTGNKTVGNFGLGETNERGENLVDFCNQNDMVITNTLFEVPLRRRYTWEAPDKRRFQLDYVLLKQRFRNQVKSCHSYPGPDIDSDHRLVLAKCNVRFKRTKRTVKKKWRVEGLKEEATKMAFEEITNKIANGNVEPVQWNDIKVGIIKATNEVLGRRKLEPRKTWMTEEILKLIQERNKLRKENEVDAYKRIKNHITAKCREAKEKWTKSIAEEIEEDQKKGKQDQAYRKIRALQYKPRTKSVVVKNKEGILLIDNDKVCARWKEYIEELYDDKELKSENNLIESINECEREIQGPPITRDEFEHALRSLKEGKATGVDDIPAELLKNLGNDMKDQLFTVVNDCYEKGIVPEDFTQCRTITIPKIGKAMDCSNYRTLSILSHASKILINVVKNRIKGKVDNYIGEDQFGFREGRGTREAILALRMLLERRMEMNRWTYLTFIDLEKAFDNVNWKLLFQTMKKIGLDWKDRRMIKVLYQNQTTKININTAEEQARIRKGVRQGCPLSPYLFNVFIEEAIQIMKEKTKGIKFNGERVHCIRYADDIVIVAESEKEMNRMLQVLSDNLKLWKLKVNERKTKVMVVRKDMKEIKTNIKINDVRIDQVKQFCYLGSTITEDNRCLVEVKRRIALAKQAFMTKKNILINKHMNIDVRKAFAKSFVWSTLLYGSESWTLGKLELNRLEATEMWIWRKMTRTSWTERKTNLEVLREVREERSLIKELEKRKIKFIGHVIRHNTFILNILEGKVLGRKRRGRPRKKYFEDIMKKIGCETYQEMKRTANSRRKWLHRQGIAFSM